MAHIGSFGMVSTSVRCVNAKCLINSCDELLHRCCDLSDVKANLVHAAPSCMIETDLDGDPWLRKRAISALAISRINLQHV